MLTFVLVDAFHLDIEHGRRVDFDAGPFADPTGQAMLVPTTSPGATPRRKAPSSTNCSSCRSSSDALTQASPILPVMSRLNPGLLSTMKRRGVTPLVLLLNFSGIICRSHAARLPGAAGSWSSATPLMA